MPTTFYIQTSGCSASQADSEQMAGLLQQAGFTLVDNLEDAYVVIINPAIDLGIDLVKQLEMFQQQQQNKIVILSGCLPSYDPKKLKLYSVIGTNQIHHVVEVVEEALNNNPVQSLNHDELPPLNSPKIRQNPMVEILPISRGYSGDCTFCKTRPSLSQFKSYQPTEIISAAQKALREGVKEIWLHSQDAFGYGSDLGTDLPALLGQLAVLPGEFKIKIGPGNLEQLIKIKDQLVKIYQHPKLFKFLHLPLQTGSDAVLKQMKKRYTVKEFNEALDKFKQAIPSLNVMTDITVGYPTERDQEFWDTLETVRRNSFDSINISLFRPRPKTPAARLPELPEEVVKRRFKVLTDIFNNISTLQNEKWFNWEGEIIIDEQGKEPGQWVGRNDAYKPVIVEGNFKLGEIVKVKVVKAEMLALRGKVISDKVTVYG
ncbi:MAG TPA: tRNA (N(6)-L-threonylcarbamoyladenosine(37)-C(2))-methylthiotransferase [Candidatus Nanoarchaeia archaeon]|nr:tRNA (N(6)-L-threonylcarbamoyladenosine(37)-C(2))-methylthiotransferase [Candidatus Nanoarchaeia archaeon]